MTNQPTPEQAAAAQSLLEKIGQPAPYATIAPGGRTVFVHDRQMIALPDAVDEDTMHIYRGELANGKVKVRWFCTHHKDRLVELACRSKQDRAAYSGLLKEDRTLLLGQDFRMDQEQVDEWVNGSDLVRP